VIVLTRESGSLGDRPFANLASVCSVGQVAPSAAFVLEKAVRDRRQHHVTLPSRQAAAFKVIEADLALSSWYCCSMAQR